MNITDITLRDFRNYLAESVRLCPFVNLVIGANGSGKTNLLEAVYLAAVGRSPRTPRDKEMIRFGADKSKIKVEAQKKFSKESVEVVLDKTANKRIAVGGLPITKMGELMGVINIVFFSPDEMRIVKESPSDRRRFMDIALSQISRNYFYVLSRYNRILAQRNKLLKSGGANADNLAPWDTQLAAAAALITKTRRGFIKNLAVLAADEHGILTGGKESLALEYEGIEGADKAEIESNFLRILDSGRERDLRFAVTHHGPHKDDFGVFISGTDARKFGSQGQQRTAALSLKLAEVSLSTRERGEPPVLLLDDVMGELDEERQRTLLERIAKFQSVITCAYLDEKITKNAPISQIIKVENGKISPPTGQ